MPFSCKRCGYVTKERRRLLRHLNRKTPCEATVLDISIQDLKREVCVNLPALLIDSKITHEQMIKDKDKQIAEKDKQIQKKDKIIDRLQKQLLQAAKKHRTIYQIINVNVNPYISRYDK